MTLPILLYLIGLLGFIINGRNVILLIISIEIILLAVTIQIVIASFNFDDIIGQVYGIYLICIAGAESAIGLGILVAFYRLRGSVSIQN
jgi:NADH-ubiquinone oxidoreductase chain 4L